MLDIASTINLMIRRKYILRYPFQTPAKLSWGGGYITFTPPARSSASSHCSKKPVIRPKLDNRRKRRDRRNEEAEMAGEKAGNKRYTF